MSPSEWAASTSHDGLDALPLGRLVEGPGAEHAAVVREGQAGHLELLGPADQVADAVGAVEEGVLGVGVEVDEAHVRTGLEREVRPDILGQNPGPSKLPVPTMAKLRQRGVRSVANGMLAPGSHHLSPPFRGGSSGPRMPSWHRLAAGAGTHLNPEEQGC